MVLSTQITSLGWECLLLPALSIVPLPLNENLLENCLSVANKIIFVSPNAVEHTAFFLPKIHSRVQIFAIGSSTALALAHHHQSAQIPENTDFNSEGLLKLPALQNLFNEHIIIFKGVGGRNLLTETLRARGAHVTEIMAYERVCPKIEAEEILQSWQNKIIACIIVTSLEALENLCQIFQKQAAWLRNQRLLVSSDRLAMAAKKMNFHLPSLKAQNATDEAILTALQNADFCNKSISPALNKPKK